MMCQVIASTCDQHNMLDIWLGLIMSM